MFWGWKIENFHFLTALPSFNISSRQLLKAVSISQRHSLKSYEIKFLKYSLVCPQRGAFFDVILSQNLLNIESASWSGISATVISRNKYMLSCFIITFAGYDGGAALIPHTSHTQSHVSHKSPRVPHTSHALSQNLYYWTDSNKWHIKSH